MHKFDYSFLNNGLLPAGLVNLTTSIAALKTMAGVRKEEYLQVFTELEAVAKVQSIKSSNAIEGIVTSDERIAAIVNQNSAPLNHNEAEIAGYRDALNEIHQGMQLLSCRDAIKASALAQQLEDLNLTRRDIEAAVLLDAMEQAEGKPLAEPFILVKGENWHQGVIGIVAGRLKDRYNLPVFALSIEGDEVKGSSRSVQGVDLGTLVLNAVEKGILSRGGGHPLAAGFSMKKEKLDDFYRYLQENIKQEDFQDKSNILEIDGVLDIGGVTIELLDKLENLAPFGEANPEPRFVIKDVMIKYVKPLKNGHIACSLTGRGGGYLNAIAFRVADTELGNRLMTARDGYFHIAGVLKKDVWQGREKVQLQIQDMANAL